MESVQELQSCPEGWGAPAGWGLWQLWEGDTGSSGMGTPAALGGGHPHLWEGDTGTSEMGTPAALRGLSLTPSAEIVLPPYLLQSSLLERWVDCATPEEGNFSSGEGSAGSPNCGSQSKLLHSLQMVPERLLLFTGALVDDFQSDTALQSLAGRWYYKPLPTGER